MDCVPCSQAWRPEYWAKFATAAAVLTLGWASTSEAATLLSSFDLPGQSATALGGGSFSSSPSPRGASVPLPTGIGGASAIAATAPERREPEVRPKAKKKVEPEEAPAPKKAPALAQAEVEAPKKKPATPAHEEEAAPKKKPQALARNEDEPSQKAPVKKEEPPAEEEPTAPKKKTHVAATTLAAPEPEPEARTEDESKSSPSALVSTASTLWTADFGWGWYNKYYFRGVNILKSVAPNTIDSGVINTKVTLAYSRELDAFSVGFGYVQALGRQLPRGIAANLPPNAAERRPEDFKVASRDRYVEYNLYAAYTRQLIQNKLQGTVGFNHYQFANGDFWRTADAAIPYTDEATARLDYIGLPFIRPSLMWAHDFDGFKGDYLEFRVDAGFDVIKRGDFGVRIEPYVGTSYDFKYNGSDNGWNALEAGLSVPVHINDHFTLTFTGNYTKALEDSAGQPRVNPGFWGGVVFNAAWGGSGRTESLLGANDKEIKTDLMRVAELESPWELSVGMGIKRSRYTFDQGSVNGYDPTKIYKPKFRTGDLGVAFRSNKNYDDGAVFGASFSRPGNNNPGVYAGTADFRIDKKNQVTPVAPRGVPQVRFTTNDYDYAQRSRKSDQSIDDDDTTAFPSISLSREIWRIGLWSLRGGLMYSFLRSDGDSGITLSRVDSLYEVQNKFGYVYPLNIIDTNTLFGDNFDSRRYRLPKYAGVVLDAKAYTAAYGGIVSAQTLRILRGSHPQQELTSTLNEVARVASFARSAAQVTSNDLEIPFSVRRDFGRLHAEVKVAPTFTFVNGTMTTDIYRRSLFTEPTEVLGIVQAKPLGGKIALSGALPPGGLFNPPAELQIDAGTPIQAAVTNEAKAPTPTTASGASISGKAGSNIKDPRLPGEDVGHSVVSRDQSDILFGATTAVSLTYDLNEEGTFYAEVWGRYRWVDSFNLSNGVSSSSINLSGFEAGLGVGVRF